MSTLTAHDPTSVAAGAGRAGHRAGTLRAYRWETAKLVSQARTRYTLLGCLLLPVATVVILNGQQRPPKDTLYGRYIHASGFAMPLLVLGFAAQWVFPLLTAIVAGDIFASEDQYGTWKTVLTRSVSRSQLFWAKTMAASTFAVAALAVFAASTIGASILIVGHQDLVGLTGQTIPARSAAGLVLGSWAVMVLPLLGFTALAVLLSVRSRNPAIGVVAPVVLGLVMQLAGSIGGLHTVRQVLLTTPFESWHGLLAQYRFYGPLQVGAAVCAGWCAICLSLAYVSLRRRDITGG
jgi:ABC-2 type transport system permease protein